VREHRVIIAGSRDFSNYSLLACKMDLFTVGWDKETIKVVSGAARGADTLGERWAEEHDIPIKRFRAKWDEYGRSAGYRRNDQMANYTTHLVAFHVDESRGTAHMIESARKAGLEVVVVEC